MARSDVHFYLSAPHPVRWAGWETDTRRLYASGWSLTTHKSIERLEMELYMENREYGIAGRATARGFDPWKVLEGSGKIEFYVNHMIRGQMRMSTTVLPSVWAQDFYPISGDMTMHQMHDFNISEIPGFFEPAKPRVREIIVDPQSVEECFEMIKRLQAPDLERIRENNRKRAPLLQAQILSFG